MLLLEHRAPKTCALKARQRAALSAALKGIHYGKHWDRKAPSVGTSMLG